MIWRQNNRTYGRLSEELQEAKYTQQGELVFAIPNQNKSHILEPLINSMLNKYV